MPHLSSGRAPDSRLRWEQTRRRWKTFVLSSLLPATLSPTAIALVLRFRPYKPGNYQTSSRSVESFAGFAFLDQARVRSEHHGKVLFLDTVFPVWLDGKPAVLFPDFLPFCPLLKILLLFFFALEGY